VAAILQKARQPFNANSMAQAAALAAMNDSEHVAKTMETNRTGLAFYEQAFMARDLEYVPSAANFVLVKVGDGDDLFAKMLSKGVIVRAMSGYKLPEWVRISIGSGCVFRSARCLRMSAVSRCSMRCWRCAANSQLVSAHADR
jgi:histidinol-phosphate aminotransferase